MKPINLGVTGGIGSGKSVVCKIFAALGIPVYDADTEAKLLMESDPLLMVEVKKLLGEEAYSSENVINRKFIAEQVFNNPEKLNALNNLIHPAVRNHYLAWAGSRGESQLVVKEAAIMFESGSWKDMDYILTVTAPEQLRISRVMQRDQKTEEHIRAILQKQLPEADLVERSDYVVINDEEHLVVPQVLAMLESLEKQLNRKLRG